ncbi:hypothetical protein K450DRAFT_250793 [Umbelopsis ramanniana AG]|uniref:Uncharacterized protein n=1 Tax=Umbelopsis ramanniana AG TaxID=1314678 RepID=A0AAD5E6H1_UMBRA|nr:uncharacterized protein K450DRAFT_250793 [Umbelopsis ramanniana AG]KAI8577777.1 hypothetical protein K450DRAFT_250793 [Umbelopsis ramanniana AG]
MTPFVIHYNPLSKQRQETLWCSSSLRTQVTIISIRSAPLCPARTEFFHFSFHSIFFFFSFVDCFCLKMKVESESVYASHGYVPYNVRSPKERKDLYDVVMGVAAGQRDDELKAQYLQHDRAAGYWPLVTAEGLAHRHPGYSDIWPPDRSANMIGIEQEPIPDNNTLENIPEDQKDKSFEIGTQMLREEFFGMFEKHQRRIGLWDTVLDLDSEKYHKVRKFYEERLNHAFSMLAEVIDLMVSVRKVSSRSSINWKEADMLPPTFPKGLRYSTETFDWRVVLHSCEHLPIPPCILQRTQRRLEHLYSVADFDPSARIKPRNKAKHEITKKDSMEPEHIKFEAAESSEGDEM